VRARRVRVADRGRGTRRARQACADQGGRQWDCLATCHEQGGGQFDCLETCHEQGGRQLDCLRGCDAQGGRTGERSLGVPGRAHAGQRRRNSRSRARSRRAAGRCMAPGRLRHRKARARTRTAASSARASSRSTCVALTSHRRRAARLRPHGPAARSSTGRSRCAHAPAAHGYGCAARGGVSSSEASGKARARRRRPACISRACPRRCSPLGTCGRAGGPRCRRRRGRFGRLPVDSLRGSRRVGPDDRRCKPGNSRARSSLRRTAREAARRQHGGGP
jgi:hypothetical protein